MQRPSSETLDSSLSRFQEYNALPDDIIHAFASKGNDSSALIKDLIEATTNLSNSLATYSSVDWTSDKLVSLLRQNSAISQALYMSEHQSRHIISALRERAGVSYGESIPLIPAQTPDWCVSRIEEWCKFAGLETFKENNKEGDVTTITSGGKVLVVDVDFKFNRADMLRPVVSVSRVKTSYALTSQSTGSSANARGSLTLDDFLQRTIQAFLTEAQRKNDSRDPQKASRLGKDILLQLQYLVMVDHLAARPDDGGLKWFIGLDEIYPGLEAFAKKEALSIALSISQREVPLDIFLHRSHALPLPYLLAPSQSFLIYLSPLAYLSSLKSRPAEKEAGNQFPIDLPLSHIRKFLSDTTEGATIATLLLIPSLNPALTPPMSVSTFLRPTFPLVLSGSEIDFVFPRLEDNIMITTSDPPAQFEWVLDFTNNGKTSGIVMSQSRMREIETVINPFSVETSPSGMGHMGTFEGESWVDLLLNQDGKTSEFYTALYASPTLPHPPLKLRLTSPVEPGFILERVPVHSTREVWAILEIAREQCWLNECLLGCEWRSEDSVVSTEPSADAGGNYEAELQSILSGTNSPQILPVNVYLPHQVVSFDPLSVAEPQRPKLLMTSPERPPITGLVEITVSFEETKQRGVSVDVRGAVGADIKMDVLEEASRRGGTFGIPGRIWLRSHSSTQ